LIQDGLKPDPPMPALKVSKARRAGRPAEQGPVPIPRSLSALKAEAADCRRCPLYRNATQTVFGEGPAKAAVMFVGEQPGDQEDLAGRPFVGPAGKLFDKALAEAGIDRRQVYVTNGVKHFKNEPRGKRRLHKKPNTSEIDACRWWLDREFALIRPRLTVAMGATAARAVMGRAITISQVRGQLLPLPNGGTAFITVHPSFLLRMPDPEVRRREYARFVADLRQIAHQVTNNRRAA
jgi:DNA polymerase